MRLKDKVCVITGAGSGIGGQAAHRFSSGGAIVVVTDRGAAAAARVTHAIADAGGRAMAGAVDVSSAEHVHTMVMLGRSGRPMCVRR